MKLVIVKNNELDEPFCYKDEKSYTISESYDEERIIPGYVACSQEGFVYMFNPATRQIFGEYIDSSQDFEEWLRMVGDPAYPSAELIEE